MHRRVTSRFLIEFLSQSTKKISQGNPFVLCFGKFPLVNKFMDNEGGVKKYFVENFSCQSAEKFHRGTFNVSLVSGIEKFYASGGFATFFC